jgi:hypothetical protein
MPYIGKSPVGGGFHKLDNLTASATATYALTLSSAAYYPETANQLLVSLNGVIQAPQDSFTVSGSNLIFDSALTASDSIDFVVALGDVLGVGSVTDGAVTTAKIGNNAVTSAKLDTNIAISGDLTVDTNTLYVDSTNNRVGIGTSSPGSKLNVISATSGGISIAQGTENFYGATSHRFFTDGYASEVLRIDSSGNVLVGTTSLILGSTGVAGVQVGSSFVSIGKTGTSSNTMMTFNNGNGQVGAISTAGSSTSYGTSSDYRLKTAVNYDWDATTRLKQLRPARFEWIADGDDAVLVDGFLAHEVQTVVPEAISGTHDEVDDNGNPVYQGIDQSKLVPLLVKTIQELEARITALEAN